MNGVGKGGAIAAEKLSEEASGLRHLRWAREVRGTLAAHLAMSASEGASAEQRAALASEVAVLGERIDELSAAVKAYRDYLERVRTAVRGSLRAAAHRCEEAASALAARMRFAPAPPPPGASPATLPDFDERTGHGRVLLSAAREAEGASDASAAVERALSAFAEARARFTDTSEPERLARARALHDAKAALRAELAAMDLRLAAVFSPAFVASIYPALARHGAFVADEGDPDDDATARR